MTSITCHSLIFIFCHYPPFEEDVTLYFIQMDSHLPKDTLCQVWLKLAWWFLSRFLKVVNAFSLYGYYLPLEKIMALNRTNLNSLYQRILCVMFGRFGPAVREEIFKRCQYFQCLDIISP